MENLKQNIDNANNLKNNIKTINNQIKESVVRGGGNTFKSLSEAPEQIRNMLKNYKKTAIANLNTKVQMTRYPGHYSAAYVNLNLNFVPNTLVVYFNDIHTKGAIVSDLNNTENSAGSVAHLVAYVDKISQSGFEIHLKDTGYGGNNVNVFKVIAIG